MFLLRRGILGQMRHFGKNRNVVQGMLLDKRTHCCLTPQYLEPLDSLKRGDLNGMTLSLQIVSGHSGFI